jgi:hypothetical protein
MKSWQFLIAVYWQTLGRFPNPTGPLLKDDPSRQSDPCLNWNRSERPETTVEERSDSHQRRDQHPLLAEDSVQGVAGEVTHRVSRRRSPSRHPPLRLVGQGVMFARWIDRAGVRIQGSEIRPGRDDCGQFT